jgi:hypothetical protein
MYGKGGWPHQPTKPVASNGEKQLAESLNKPRRLERMKSILKTLSAVALSGVMVLPVLADDTTANTDTDAKDVKDLKKVVEDQGINYVETAQKGITLSGYVDVSYTEQFAGRGTGSGSSQANLRQFDTQNDNFNVQAVKIALEKALPDKNEWAAGFRIDTIYGADARYLGDSGFQSSSSAVGQGTSAATNGSGLALEQALVKFRIPVGNGLDIYAGKFVTFLGYEVIESPANPNYSRGLLFTNAIPLTNTGVYADYKFNDTFEAKLGVVDGWNSSVSSFNGSDETFGNKAITGQLNINAPGKNANITQSFIYSPQGDSNAANPTEGPALNNPGPTPNASGNNPVFVYDIWGNWTPTFDKSGNTTLGFNIDYGYDSYSWYGAALYAQYKLTKVITLAGRGEYLHSDANAGKFGAGGVTNSTTIGGVTTSVFTPEAQDDYSLTATISFAIWDNLLTRAEYRFDDLSSGSTGSTANVQNEVSLEAVYSF